MFATLQGVPVNTTGWYMVGKAKLGNTSAGPVGSKNELILCDDSLWGTGACFIILQLILQCVQNGQQNLITDYMTEQQQMELLFVFL